MSPRKSSTMLAAVLTPDGFALRRIPIPCCGRGQVLIRVVGCGVCSGDVHAYRHREQLRLGGQQSWRRFAGVRNHESLMGHEPSGVIAELGTRVRGLQVGQAVTALDGAYAEYCLAGAEDVAALAEGVDPLWALGEAVACCVHASWRSPLCLSSRVAVVGCGFMGQVCAQLARLQGAARVLAIDPVPWRRRMALRLGADAAAGPDAVPPESLAREHGPFDIVIEAAGTQSALDLCAELADQHGCINIVGYHQSDGGVRSVPMQRWNYKALTVVNGHVRRIEEKRQAMRAGMALLAAGRLKLQPLVKVYPLAEAGQAFADLEAMRRGLFKAVLAP